jgi:hypothetical protein
VVVVDAIVLVCACWESWLSSVVWECASEAHGGSYKKGAA